MHSPFRLFPALNFYSILLCRFFVTHAPLLIRSPSRIAPVAEGSKIPRPLRNIIRVGRIDPRENVLELFYYNKHIFLYFCILCAHVLTTRSCRRNSVHVKIIVLRVQFLSFCKDVISLKVFLLIYF